MFRWLAHGDGQTHSMHLELRQAFTLPHRVEPLTGADKRHDVIGAHFVCVLRPRIAVGIERANNLTKRAWGVQPGTNEKRDHHVGVNQESIAISSTKSDRKTLMPIYG
jgi:hypothetical protein